MRSKRSYLPTPVRRIFNGFDRLFMRAVRGVRHVGWKAWLMSAIGAVLVIIGAFVLWASTLQLPDLSSLQSERIQQSLQLYDRTDTVLLYDLHSDAQRTVVPLSAISPNIQNATIAVEDPNFYTDVGIEPTAIARAFLADILSGSAAQGGSTLTQQVIKNVVLNNDKSLTRKLKEAVLAIKMDQEFSKDDILALYLNSVPYGGTLYGAEAASEAFFGIHASDVDLAQAAYMAAVLPAPTYYSPWGDNKADLDARKNLVLQDMQKHGYITEAQMEQAEQEQVTFQAPHSNGITAPHFVFYVEQYLENKYGPDALAQGGWRVTTTLDADLQAQAQQIVQTNALANVTKFDASNMALMAIDPTNGQILAMVGSRNYFDTQIDGAFNAATTPPGRQPGSAFKPFVYAQAFSEGYTPDTVLFDLPTQFSTACSPEDNTDDTPPCYSPVDFDNLWRGPMTLRDALAQSINVPAVKLLYLVGETNAIKLAKAMGISTLGDPSQYGLTLVLGGGEVTLLDMTNAYGVFADNGIYHAPISVLRITDSSGNIIEDNTQNPGTQVMAPFVAQEINDVLSDPVARAPLGENEYFEFPGHDVAVKTGTTNNYKDAWTIGYTPNLVIGIWAGNNDDSPMTHNVSGFIVGPAWNQIMSYALTKLPDNTFTRTQEDESQLKPILRGDWQVPGADGNVHEILYWVDKSNPLGPPPADPAADPQFEYWDYPVLQWDAQNGYTHMAPVSTTPASTGGQVIEPAASSPDYTAVPNAGETVVPQ